MFSDQLAEVIKQIMKRHGYDIDDFLDFVSILAQDDIGEDLLKEIDIAIEMYKKPANPKLLHWIDLIPAAHPTIELIVFCKP